MAKIILKIFGAFFIAFGLIGLFIEAPALFSGKEAGAFGLALALIILFFGTMTLIISSRSRNSAKSPGKNTKAHRAPGSYVNTLSILGMIFSGLNIAAGAGIVLFGGVFLSLLFSEKSESGW